MAVVLESMLTERSTLANSPPGTGIAIECQCRSSQFWISLTGLIVDADLEAGGAPINQVEAGLGFQRSNGGVGVTRNDITAVEQGNSHVFAVAGIADNHLVAWFEAL